MLRTIPWCCKISDIITKRFIKHLDKLAKDEKETYKEFYAQFSRYLKEGVVTSWPNKESLASCSGLNPPPRIRGNEPPSRNTSPA